MRTGETVRDNVTGLRGRVVRVDSAGVVINRAPIGQAPDTRHYTWRSAYEWTVPGHRRLEVVR